jgi:uncharacterized repeat protein (TIGR01451 family)
VQGSPPPPGLRAGSCKSLLLAILALIGLAGALAAQAGDNTWTPLGPDGGYISRVIFHPAAPNIVYARASGGFFRSTDGGAHWQQPNPQLTQFAVDVAVDPADGNRVYLALNQIPSRVVVSTDAGVTFSTLFAFGPTVSTPNLLAISADGNTLYAFCNTQVFRSTNRGTSWQQRTDVVRSFSGGRGAVIDPSDPNTLYLMRDDQLLVTHDGGGTWASTGPSGASKVQDIEVDPSDPNRLWVASVTGLYLSTNRGTSWASMHGAWTTAVSLDPQSPSTVYLGQLDGRVLRRNGPTWTDITNTLGSLSPSAIAISPHNSAKVAVANARGLWITTNSGGSWARSDAGLVSTAIAGFAVSTAQNRIYTKGNAFSRLDDGSDVPVEIDEGALFQVLGSQSSQLTALAPVLESGNGLIAGVSNRIARSLNGGASWTLTGYTSAVNDIVTDLTATTTAPSVYYASSAQTLKRSTDQGVNWTPIVSGLPGGSSPGIIAIAPSNQSILYAGPRDPLAPSVLGLGVYKSTNSGDAWTAANAGIADRAVTAIAIHPTNPDIVYIGTSFSLMKTVDGGATWTSLPWSTSLGSLEILSITIDRQAPDTVYVAGGLGLMSDIGRSTDGGTTWVSLASAATPFPWGPTALAIDSTRPNTLRVGSGWGGIRQMTIRADQQPNLAIQVNPSGGEIPLHAATLYTYTISNLGPGQAGSVDATIQLPASITAVSAVPSVGTCTVASTTVTCSAPALNSNGTMNIAVSITPTVSELLMISAFVHADRLEAQPGDNTLHHLTFAREFADVSATINNPTGMQTGATLQYTVTVTNSGPSPANGVTAFYTTPGGMTLGTFNITTGTCSTTAFSGVICQIGTMSPGTTVTLTVNGTVATAGNYQVTAGASGTGNDGNQANNTAQVTTTVNAPPAPPPPPPATGGNSGGGGGGGGAMSPLALLALLAIFLMTRRRAAVTAALLAATCFKQAAQGRDFVPQRLEVVG